MAPRSTYSVTGPWLSVPNCGWIAPQIPKSRCTRWPIPPDIPSASLSVKPSVHWALGHGVERSPECSLLVVRGSPTSIVSATEVAAIARLAPPYLDERFIRRAGWRRVKAFRSAVAHELRGMAIGKIAVFVYVVRVAEPALCFHRNLPELQFEDRPRSWNS